MTVSIENRNPRVGYYSQNVCISMGRPWILNRNKPWLQFPLKMATQQYEFPKVHDPIGKDNLVTPRCITTVMASCVINWYVLLPDAFSNEHSHSFEYVTE